MAVHDRTEQIASRTVVHDEVDVFSAFDDFVEGDDVGVIRHFAVDGDLAFLGEGVLGTWWMSVKTFNGVVGGVRPRMENVLSEVNDSVGASPEHLQEPKAF